MTPLLKTKKHIKTLLKGKIANEEGEVGAEGMNKTLFCEEGVVHTKKKITKQTFKCISNLLLIQSPHQFQANIHACKKFRLSQLQKRDQNTYLCK